MSQTMNGASGDQARFAELFAQGTAQIPHLARRILTLTASPEQQRTWRSARNDARKILRRCREEGYLATTDAEFDLDYLVDLVTDLLPYPEPADERTER